MSATYRAELLDAAHNVLATSDTKAWNSAIRASEALIREHARLREVVFAGDAAVVEHPDGTPHDRACGYDCTTRVYERRWHNEPYDGAGMTRTAFTRVRRLLKEDAA